MRVEDASRYSGRSSRRRERDRPGRQAGWCAIGLTVLALAPVIVTLVTRAGRTYLPAGDLGTIDLRVRDVWSAHIPLVGPYSRYGWSHPGPLFFYLLAVPSGLFGQAAWATLVGGALLHGVAIVWLAKLAWQRGGLPLVALALVGLGLVYAAMGPWIMLEPWNPYVVVPFFALFVFQVWLIATGEPRFLPGATFVGSFLVQTHVGYAPLVLAAVTVAAIFVVLDQRRSRTWRRDWRRPLLTSLALGVLLWLPPLVDMLLHWPGNVADVARYFLTGGNAEPAIGFTRGLELMAREFRWLPEWLGGSTSIDLDGGAGTASALLLIVPAALLTLALVAGFRSGSRGTKRFSVLAATLFVTGTLTLGRVTGVPYSYLFYWRPILAVCVAVSAGVAMATAIRRHQRAWMKPLGLLAAGVVVIATYGGLAVDIADHPAAVSPVEPVTESLVRQLESHHVPARGAILRLRDTGSLLQLHRGIFDQLDRDGVPVFVDRNVAYEFGSQRGAATSDVAAVWLVAESSRALTELTAIPGSRLIAFHTPLRANEEAEMAHLQREFYTAIVAAHRPDLLDQLDSPFGGVAVGDLPGIDKVSIDLLRQLNRKVSRSGTCRCGVVAFRPDVAPPTLSG